MKEEGTRENRDSESSHFFFDLLLSLLLSMVFRMNIVPETLTGGESILKEGF